MIDIGDEIKEAADDECRNQDDGDIIDESIALARWCWLGHSICGVTLTDESTTSPFHTL